MKKPVLYLETSLFGFYFDDEPRNATKRESVIVLFDEIQKGRFIAVTSPITIRELSRAPVPFKSQFLNILFRLEVNELKTNVDEVEQLTIAYVREKNYPGRFL